MAPARTYTHTLLICPHCGEQTGRRIDHLLDGRKHSWGSWDCDACGQYFRGTVENNEVTVERTDEIPKRRALSLLKIEAGERRVFFVMDHWRYSAERPETEEQESERYFFEEHSCPTNWLRDCVTVIEDGDPDPHGFMEFVRSVPIALDFDEDNDDAVRELFPEAFATHPTS